MAKYRSPNERELASLPDSGLLERVAVARDEGHHEEARSALGVLLFRYLDDSRRRARVKLPEADAEEVATEAIVGAISSALSGTWVGEFRARLNRLVERRIAQPEGELRDESEPSPEEHREDAGAPGERSALGASTGAIDVEEAVDDALARVGERRGGERPTIDVERLLREYVQEHRSGGAADPPAYLERLEGADRAELDALIDAYLQRAPAREWDGDSYRGSSAERLAESLGRSLGGRSGLWPALLPRLRERAELKRSELGLALAVKLGVADREQKVAAYYHQMEQGELPSKGVSRAVLEALGEILGLSAEELRRAGEQFAPPAPGDPGEGAGTTDWDEVDELFRGWT